MSRKEQIEFMEDYLALDAPAFKGGKIEYTTKTAGVNVDLSYMPGSENLASIDNRISQSLLTYIERKDFNESVNMPIATASDPFGSIVMEAENPDDSTVHVISYILGNYAIRVWSISKVLYEEDSSIKYESGVELAINKMDANTSFGVVGIIFELLLQLSNDVFLKDYTEKYLSVHNVDEDYTDLVVIAKEAATYYERLKENHTDSTVATESLVALTRLMRLAVAIDNGMDVKDRKTKRMGGSSLIQMKGHLLKSRDRAVKNFPLERLVNPGNFNFFVGDHLRTVEQVEKDMKSLLPESYIDKYRRNDFYLSSASLELIQLNKQELINKGILLHPIAEEIAVDFINNPGRPYVYMLEGASGSGKTTIGRQVSALLGLPFRAQSVRGDSDTADIVGGFVPRSEGQILPDRYMMEHDPEGAYTMLKGYEFIPSEVHPKLTDDILNRAYQLAKAETDFVYVETPISTTFREGGVVDIQELNTSAPEAVISLNSMFAEGMFKPQGLSDYVYRNPNSLFIMTMNPEYRGTNSINESIISRVDGKYMVNTPDDKEMIARVVSSLGIDYSDLVSIRLLDEMMKVFRDLEEQAENYPGVIDFRSFENWVAATIIHKDAVSTCRTRVITKMVEREDDANDLYSSYLENSKLAESMRIKAEIKLKNN